jgi:hypothetical protein
MAQGKKYKGGGGNAHDRAVSTAAGKSRKPPVPTSHKELQDSKGIRSSVRSYLRGTGISAILLGGLGLLQPFYLPSVIAIYSGILLLAVDVTLEKISPLFKSVAIVILVLFGAALTHFVVLWKDPLSILYNPGKDGTIYLNVLNSTDDDFRSVDLHFSMPLGDFVIKTWPLSQQSSCSLLILPSADALLGDESLTITGSSGEFEARYGSYERLRCEVLPHRSNMPFAILVEQRQGEQLVPLEAPISAITVRGDYQGKFRLYKAPKEATLIPDSYSPAGWVGLTP